MNAGLTFTDSVICYKELIEKEDTARRVGKQRLKEKDVTPVKRFKLLKNRQQLGEILGILELIK